MSTEQQQLHSIAVNHIQHCFSHIKQQVEQAGKEVAAYYFYLVDDFFAAGNAAITHQDLAAFAAKHKKEYKNCTILQAIWDGRCTLYEDKTEIQNASDDWLENQSELYQVAYRGIENLDDDDTYQQKRTEYETALIAALQQCDQEGLFGIWWKWRTISALPFRHAAQPTGYLPKIDRLMFSDDPEISLHH